VVWRFATMTAARTIVRFKASVESDNPVYLAGREHVYKGLRGGAAGGIKGSSVERSNCDQPRSTLPSTSCARPTLGIDNVSFAGSSASPLIGSPRRWRVRSARAAASVRGPGTVEFSPDGIAQSPAVTGFTGMGVVGVEWGTGVTLDKVWVTSFNGKIGLIGL
jgi:hypothetical protein